MIPLLILLSRAEISPREQWSSLVAGEPGPVCVICAPLIRYPLACRLSRMPITREQALQQLQAWTTNPSLLTHARSVEIVMRAAASKYGGDPDVWAVTGLLHDADYDQWPAEHPKRIVDWLR